MPGAGWAVAQSRVSQVFLPGKNLVERFRLDN
jgi:hypothetical protein